MMYCMCIVHYLIIVNVCCVVISHYYVVVINSVDYTVVVGIKIIVNIINRLLCAC